MASKAQDGAADFIKAFSDPAAIANYAEGPPRFMPGFESLHRMTSVLLAEHAPDDARVLVLGAGGGLEIKALATAQPGWTFVGVDPAAPMLDVARRTLGPLMARVELIEGYIDAAPAGPFDAATCLLTLHFLDAAERERTVRAIHQRLKPGAPFVAAHGSYPQDAARELWLSRYAAYAVASGAEPEQAQMARNAVSTSVNMMDPEDDLGILRAGGFADADPFFAAFTWRGWIGHA
ncbi:class I SAM-dependent methyltransferase [Sphingosinicella soli]|uniref:tRNA (Cmo5U34)-methyltransferase n=1 Tax=Sphingosinicella soli TaxID=333708 RepID=A0A7W7B3S8_9SPHN|nr:class I SAM-dependent methyltransferase [Sphingosinicella soli]MBB4633493.1 tRNA (cmo5U34)-methyltransferase [Sphingosinicella soli]